ncbi:MAG: hypothetical protein ABSG35_14285 [Syntrophobacteraceae bacterium]
MAEPVVLSTVSWYEATPESASVPVQENESVCCTVLSLSSGLMREMVGPVRSTVQE